MRDSSCSILHLGKRLQTRPDLYFTAVSRTDPERRMKRIDLGLNLWNTRTRKREFLDGRDRVVPRDALVESIAPFAPEGKTGRPPFAVQTTQRLGLQVAAGEVKPWTSAASLSIWRSGARMPLMRPFWLGGLLGLVAAQWDTGARRWAVGFNPLPDRSPR